MGVLGNKGMTFQSFLNLSIRLNQAPIGAELRMNAGGESRTLRLEDVFQDDVSQALLVEYFLPRLRGDKGPSMTGMALFAAGPLINPSIASPQGEESGLSLSSSRHSNPSPEEYEDRPHNNKLLRKAIEAEKERFLKDSKQGFVADNIHVGNFASATFTFLDGAGMTKEFTGRTLIKKRKKEIKIDGIISLLRGLGIEVEGEFGKLTNPTEEEYADNQRMREAIEAGKERFLKDPKQGFVADNIRVNNFATATFTFVDGGGITRGFTGITLLRNRKKEKKIDGIISLLRGLGIEVAGGVEKSSNPTEEEYTDNELMRVAIEAGKERFLKDPEQGFVGDNIHMNNFANAQFTFVDGEGMTKGFTGQTLIKKRKKEKKIDGIISLLRGLGIEVAGEVGKLPNPTEEEYADNQLMRVAIETGKDQFLRDPKQGFVADNIHVGNFTQAILFTFVDGSGITKGFVGGTLLTRRGQERNKGRNIDGIISLLLGLGIEVAGEVGKLPNPTEEEYADNQLMRVAIETGKDQFLRDPKQGFVADNIHARSFGRASFAFLDRAGKAKGFVGDTLHRNRKKEINIDGTISLLRELGIEVYDTTAEALIEKYNLHDEVVKLGDDSALLFRYLLLTHPDLTEEAIREITTSAFKGIKENNRIAAEELHAAYRIEEGEFAELHYPASTEGSYVEISGKIEGPFESVQILGDGTKKIAVRPDGTFSGKVRLKIGEANSLQIYGVHEEMKIKSSAVTLLMDQTGIRENPEKILADLISKVEGLEAELMADPHRLAYLAKTYERELMRRFMSEGVEAGFAALKEKIRTCDSKLFKKIYSEIEKKFSEVARLSVPGFRSDQKLYFFQKYCLHEIKRAMEDPQGVPALILANEQGLGKTLVMLAALELMKRQGLIIAPNAVVTTWGEQHGHFFAGEPLKVIQGEAQKRAEAFEEHARRTRVTNMEYLRSEAQSRFDGMNRPGDQVLIFDEAQFLSSTSSLQSAGARKLKGGFKFLVSATPFSSIKTARPILEFMEGDQYGNGRFFGEVFNLDDPDSLRLLHLMMDRYVLRFRKRDVFKEYDPRLPLESQGDRLPAKNFIDPDEIGKYELTEKQCEAVLEIFLNWEDWQERLRGKPLTYEDRLIMARTKNFFSRRESLRQSMNHPRYGGVDTEESPKHRKMDEIAELEVEKGKGKLVIFCRYRAEVEEYARRYARYGAMTYYGGTSERDGKKQDWLKDAKGNVRKFKMKNENEYAIGKDGRLIEDKSGGPIDPLDYSRLMFQNNPKTRILISTYESGAVGITFTAADAVVLSDMARDYVIQYQAEDRANRIDNERKKYDVRYYSLIAKYPQSFLEKMKGFAVVRTDGSAVIRSKKEITDAMRADEDLIIEDLYETYLSQGTYDEVHRQNIEAQRRVFELIIDGIHSEGEQSEILKSKIFEKMPFLFRNGLAPESTAEKEEETAAEIEENR